ncbi:MAG: tetratricopeptide repeat protein [FCB group bacterium]|nr:tetratricopeptide repeat protein [FCB group bacterium]MBL7027802.1 tetratricopeptide repeat protein [Candidatus Neomarinimicrobiota bacterium]MBL7120883.1 tetratricopeptide repeat protein [Candidatus Neomarinimicrobiota bacterium]
MNRSRRSIIFLALGMFLCLAHCAKEELATVSLAKVPVTTESSLAAEEFQRGMTFANTLQAVEAATHFRLALDADPTFASAWLNLAYVSPGTGLFIACLDSAKAHASKASEGEQLIILAAKYGFEGNNTKQEKTLQKLVDMYPGDESALLILGNYYFGLRQYHQAIQSYNQATRVNNNMAILHNQLGYSQRALGNYGEAEKAFKFYIKLNSENPNAYDSYAELLMEMGRFNESIEFYAKALELDPNFVASHIGIACDYAFLGEPDRARTQLELLKEIARNDIDTRRAIFTEALTYVCEGNLSQAVQSILSNLKLAEESQDVGNMANDLVILGNLYLELNQPSKALDRYNQSIDVIDKSTLPQAVKMNAHTTHLFNISRVFALEGEFEKARETSDLFAEQVGIRKNPIQVKLISQLNGIIALGEKRYQTAIDKLEEANQLNPYNLFRIGQAYEGLGETEQAARFKLQAKELNVLNSMDQALVLSKTKFSKNPA